MNEKCNQHTHFYGSLLLVKLWTFSFRNNNTNINNWTENRVVIIVSHFHFHFIFFARTCIFSFSQYSINMNDEAREMHKQQIERAEIAGLVRNRMEALNLPSIDYDDVSEKRNSLSYVIINPSCDLKLQEGDIM